MRVFLTGATGYKGKVVAEKLLGDGHEIVGLARSQVSAKTLEKQGIEPHLSDVNDPEMLTLAVQGFDGIIHTAFDMGSGDFTAAIL